MPNGRAFFVELKAQGKAPTPLQRHEHELLRSLGHTVLIIDNIGGRLCHRVTTCTNTKSA